MNLNPKMLIMKRRPGMSPEALRDNYEHHRVPFVSKYAGGISRYLQRSLEPQPDPETGFPGELRSDVITELWFEDKTSAQNALFYLSETIMPAEIVVDEKPLFDRQASSIVTAAERVS